LQLDQRTSVNQLVREYLQGWWKSPAGGGWPGEVRKAFETGLVEIGDRTWSREDLYDR